MENLWKGMIMVCVEIFDWYSKCLMANGSGGSIIHNFFDCTQNFELLNSANFAKQFIRINKNKWSLKNEWNKIQMEMNSLKTFFKKWKLYL